MKRTYVITYDVSDPENYPGIRAAIKAYGTWAHINNSTWAVVTDESASEIRDYLATVVGTGDSIFVVESGGGSAWRNVNCRGQWLKKYL